jgi:hypothetical protein
MAIIEYKLEDGTSIYFEAKDRSAYNPISTLTDVVAANQTFDQALDKIKPTVRLLLEKLRELRADEAEVEFGLKVSAQAGLIFASGDVEANYVVKLKWVNSDGAKT